MKLHLLFIVAGFAMAQSGSSGGTVGGMISGPSVTFASNSTVGFPPRVVVGMPYSAEELTEHVQILADGTRITQPPRKVLLYRDSQGRTRRERIPAVMAFGVDARVPPSVIDIADPVSGVRYTFDARAQVAHKSSMPAQRLPPPVAASAARGDLPPIRTETRAAGRLVNPTTSSPILTSATGLLPQPDRTNGPNVSSESLGQRTIEGVVADGTRTTTVYPVGSIGNDRPISVVSETWTSRELKRAVLLKTTDPRNGESSTRLTRISRAEPAASLFEVPTGYKIIDQTQSVTPNR
ncbi:MAG: hypothetical protein JWN34_4036 [Bryobacterales bacterium]|nr:hypothetical protein [Bryobacterales bacterium]